MKWVNPAYIEAVKRAVNTTSRRLLSEMNTVFQSESFAYSFRPFNQ
jgi:hypothetical protein